MKTRIKTEPKFIVKPEDKVVVCKMKVDMQLIDSECWPYIGAAWYGNKALKVNQFGEFTVKAIARCNPEDTFDEVIGKRIAESRAKAKAFKTATNVWLCITKGLKEQANIAGTMAAHCELVRKAEVEHVEKLSE